MIDAPVGGTHVTSPIPVLAINLDRSADRWSSLSRRAQAIGLDLVRVPAVDGATVASDQQVELSRPRFALWHGRRPLPSEYGCYMSHLRALRTVVDERWPHAVILEDDAAFEPDFSARLAALANSPAARTGLIKFYNHRIKGFVPKASSSEGDVIGSCVHGPLGSSMAYLVSQAAAASMVQGLLPMYLPYDIALERSWSHGAPVYVTRDPLCRPAEEASTIGSYGHTKYPFFMRVPTAIFRGVDYARRATAALLPAKG